MMMPHIFHRYGDNGCAARIVERRRRTADKHFSITDTGSVTDYLPLTSAEAAL